ncbi:O-acetyltransferase [Crucibulum laeve]|uniref:O-acetyltransferase n=1 Tax=Crucibulum laeve TaxID=68775 RepID=A0A5C3MBP7_9AGAR|nr:O-acetyltransferase [Crucibulum laeve]
MPPLGTSAFSLNPSWPRYAGIAATILAILIGLPRYFLFDSSDPIHCNALVSKGTWLDPAHKNWQPDGCMLHSYTLNEGATCLRSREVKFIGDSVTRKLFFQFAHMLDPALPTIPQDDTQKHADHSLQTKFDTQLSFTWDPFLNSSATQEVLTPKFSVTRSVAKPPALLIVGSGLWYLRYSNASGGIPAWEANMERVLNILTQSPTRIADSVVILPVEQVVASKLSPERADSMHPWDVDAMNSDLFHRIHPPTNDRSGISLVRKSPTTPVVLPLAFNQMLDALETDDGLHFSDSVIKTQASILLNLRCNDILPQRFPLDKTCCNRYPWPSFLQSALIFALVAWGPYVCYRTYKSSPRIGKHFVIGEKELPALITSTAVALIFLADRTGFWLKEQKQFNGWSFGILSLISLAIGLMTVKRVDKDLGFLNRDQTDEWKGWMQIAILIYHYLGASKISGIYNPIRVLVACYLFMTGYGHTTFYLRKADFGFLRIAQVMVRLNLLTVLLAYTMDTDYISYYFAPLVSMWFLIIYGTLAVGSQYNDRVMFVLAKIALSAAAMTWFMWQSWPLELLFTALSRVCAIHWSAREWSFRVNLDLWIVYVGMLASVAVIKAREFRLTEQLYWPVTVKGSAGASIFALLWFFAFELYQESKFTYNLWHPYISFIPVLAFVVLRNSTAILRSASSRAFAFIGKCSLETFIIQYHFWLAGDTKGVLLVIPGTQWRPINMILTTIMFIYLSDRVAYATGEITSRICGGTSKGLPLPNTVSTHSTAASSSRNEADIHSDAHSQEVTIPLIPSAMEDIRKDEDGNRLPPEPDTPGRPRRWVDRLADGEPSVRLPGFKVLYGASGWEMGVNSKLAVAAGIMWTMNLLWRYPEV